MAAQVAPRDRAGPLLLQRIGALSPASQVPFHFAATVAASGRGSGRLAKLGLSGQNPPSMTPMMVPSPAPA
ncbi:hypothetical protein [Jidongwangia harbinensis]|uniref:hypothetical protein n=1 Tax=Jidongwangia harbinensis TaxID=2878561 RepID=UPI001CDA1C09|nr:hypothetical protein [Jidongwangia harbinensis]MCA2217477.1 hypothetical protein [Jidongwangia harbinensis]